MTHTALISVTDTTDVEVAQLLLQAGHRIGVVGSDLALLMRAARGYGASQVAVIVGDLSDTTELQRAEACAAEIFGAPTTPPEAALAA